MIRHMIRMVVVLCLGLTVALDAAAQGNPVAEARAAGLYGIQPRFGTSESARLQQTIWERYGLFLREHANRAYVAGLKPGGAAAQQGAKVGDVLRGTDAMGASAELSGVLQGFRNVMRRTSGNGAIVLYVFDADSRWQREYRLTAAAPDGTVASIPPALRGAVTSHPGLMAIISGEPERAGRGELIRDTYLALQAISRHNEGCSGPRAVTIPVAITVTTTLRDGRGINRGTLAPETYSEELRVRPEFAPWAQGNINAYPMAAVSNVRTAVMELITLEGCDGAGFLQLEDGLAKAIGVALRRPAAPASAPAAAGGFGNADAFISECYALSLREARSAGRNPSERSTATICMCQEHAARQSGDPRLHATLQVRDVSYYDANPQMHESFRQAFQECWRAPDGSEFDRRAREVWRKLRL